MEIKIPLEIKYVRVVSEDNPKTYCNIKIIFDNLVSFEYHVFRKSDSCEVCNVSVKGSREFFFEIDEKECYFMILFCCARPPNDGIKFVSELCNKQLRKLQLYMICKFICYNDVCGIEFKKNKFKYNIMEESFAHSRKIDFTKAKLLQEIIIPPTPASSFTPNYLENSASNERKELILDRIFLKQLELNLQNKAASKIQRWWRKKISAKEHSIPHFWNFNTIMEDDTNFVLL